MPRGGIREGAGRKAGPSRKTLREKQNTDFDAKASDALPVMFETLHTIATGYQIAVYEKPRKVKTKEMYDAAGETLYVYTVPPDKAAAMYLIDRAAGKASVKSTESVDTELTLEVTMSAIEEPDADE